MIYVVITSLYLLLLTGIIIYKSRTVKTEEDFVVAGRAVPVYLLVGTLVCTWIGSGSLFGTAGLSFRSGFSEIWFSMGAWIGIIIIYFIAARVRKISKYTLTDLLETRYNKAAKLLGTITIIVAYIMIAGYQFKGGGRFINILSDGNISAEQGMIISAIVIIGFTSLAGMVSIVSIDIFNGIVMIIAMFLALPFAIGSHGGWSEVVNTINQTNPDYLSMFEGHDAFWVLGIILPTFLLLMSESSLYQKFSSAKDEKSAKRAVIGMLIGVVVIEVLMCAVAVVGFAIYSDDMRFFLSDGSINSEMAEEIILRIGYEQMPPLAGSLLFAAGVAIILSTGNTFLMVTSTNVTRDLIKPFILKNRVARNEKSKSLDGNDLDDNKTNTKSNLILQRTVIVVLGILAYLIVTQFDTILEMAFISYTMIGAALAPVLMASFFWKRANAAGGIASIIAGMIVPVINKVLEVNEIGFTLWGISFPLNTDYIAIPALIMSLLLLVVVTLLTAPPQEAKWKPFFD